MIMAWNASGAADGMQFGVIPGPAEVQRVLEVAGVADRLTYWSANGAGLAPRGPSRRA
jgi:hypothetical protein